MFFVACADIDEKTSFLKIHGVPEKQHSREASEFSSIPNTPKDVNIFDKLYDKEHPFEIKVESQFIRTFSYVPNVKPGYYVVKRNFLHNDKKKMEGCT